MGLGPMKGVINAQVQRDKNKIPVLTMTYDKDDELAPQIKEGRIIVTTMGPRNDEKEQKFRITEIGGDELQSLSITANHIAGDLAYNVITKDISIANASAGQAFEAIKEALADPVPGLSFYSDILKVANLGWEFKSVESVTSILLGEDQEGDTVANTMEAMYQGEWLFDNYNLSLVQHGGDDTGLVVKYGRRLKSLTQDTNIDNTYNAIFPYSTYSPNTVAAEEGGEDFDGQGVVQYVGSGGAETYNSPYKGHTVNGHVKNGTFYHVEKVAKDNTVNDDTWYLIGNGQWIDEHFFSFDKTGAYIVNKVKAQGTVYVPDDSTEGQGLIVDYAGVGTIAYAGKGQVALWTSPFSGHTITGYRKNGSRWKIFAKAVDYNGKTWYCLGNRRTQWIDGQYLKLDKVTDYSQYGTHGILSVNGTKEKVKIQVPTGKYTKPRGKNSVRKPRYKKKTITVVKNMVNAMTGPGTGKSFKWSANKGSRWLITNIATDYQGKTWYQISTHIWVEESDAINFTSSGTVKPDYEEEQKRIAKTTGKIPVYRSPNGTRVYDQWLNVGDQVPITAQAESHGKTWYEIGEGKWVDASYFTFENNTDVPPGEDDGTDNEVQVQDVTVTLPNLVLTSPFMGDDERLRIKTVDLSSYNIQDPDKLQEVAEAYMKEYRIGYPNVSLTFNYQQICDEVDLYDLVLVQYDQLNLQQKAEVNSVLWDPLKEEFTQITIGDLPVSYEHVLGQYVQQTVEKNTHGLERKNQHLFGEMRRIVQLQGDDQKAALEKLGQKLDMTKDSYTRDRQNMLEQVEKIDGDVKDIQSWIDGGSNNVIQAYPNWRSPTELRAQTNDGGLMKFNSNGLEFLGRDNVLRTAISSDGRIAGEYVDFGRVDALSIKGVDIEGTGNIYCHSSGQSAVMSDAGFSATNGAYTIATNGYDIRLSAGSSTHWFTWNDLYRVFTGKKA